MNPQCAVGYMRVVKCRDPWEYVGAIKLEVGNVKYWWARVEQSTPNPNAKPASPFTEVGTIVFFPVDAAIGFLMEGKEYALIHEGVVVQWIPASEAPALEIHQRTAADIQAAVSKLNSSKLAEVMGVN